ncbi:hypothetical protein BABINDRAFT_161486 [Babjeviella inositovora NRRL Y-12698]|uniref:Letm1 RBD domain-containing protein n=1 Tax=Babjeviella inositovora NRRL Y-12698 TaxID=984486 RepID=A0A1E3QRX9_9ASCO|nr:uncharacterized protein BABINDRAFT_161486 [Babjeviella inositovora NRRL Y-12698]ODQ79792.1 hypothetical protein BABINDRAFT_161486 [Babjeviella inositovora NRRL Y-12698]
MLTRSITSVRPRVAQYAVVGLQHRLFSGAIPHRIDRNTKRLVPIPKDVMDTPIPLPQPPNTDGPKPPLRQRIKDEAAHYWHGTKLLGYEIKVATKLLVKMATGYELSRRETNQLQRTIVDVGKLVPFSMFVIIPFAEALLPVALKFFPGMLPSTYESTTDKYKKKQRLLKTRKDTSEFIQKTLEEKGIKMPKKMNDQGKKEFVEFFDIMKDGGRPTDDHIVKVARYFKNDQVLDNLSRPQLVAMAKYMNLKPFGTDEILRYQIRHRLLKIIKDDKVIDYEGVESLSIQELQSACQLRGIKSLGVSPGRLRDDLQTWLNLRLKQKIPSTLLILSSTYTFGEGSDNLRSYYDALLAVLSGIPDEVYNLTKLDVLKDAAEIDAKLKMEILKEQEELIKEENQQQGTTKAGIKDSIKLSDYEEEVSDKAEPATETGEAISEKETELLKQETKAPQETIAAELNSVDEKKEAK